MFFFSCKTKNILWRFISDTTGQMHLTQRNLSVLRWDKCTPACHMPATIFITQVACQFSAASSSANTALVPMHSKLEGEQDYRASFLTSTRPLPPKTDSNCHNQHVTNNLLRNNRKPLKKNSGRGKCLQQKNISTQPVTNKISCVIPQELSIYSTNTAKGKTAPILSKLEKATPIIHIYILFEDKPFKMSILAKFIS